MSAHPYETSVGAGLQWSPMPHGLQFVKNLSVFSLVRSSTSLQVTQKIEFCTLATRLLGRGGVSWSCDVCKFTRFIEGDYFMRGWMLTFMMLWLAATVAATRGESAAGSMASVVFGLLLIASALTRALRGPA